MEQTVFEDYMKNEREKISEMVKEVILEAMESEEETILRSYYKKALENFLILGRRRLPIAFINTYYGITPESVIVENYDEIYRISTSIEFLYAASIIHDDIVDNEELRGGKPTYHRYFASEISNDLKKKGFEPLTSDIYRTGESLALFGGNMLMGLGINLLNSSDFPEKIRLEAIKSYIKAFHAVNRSQIIEEFMKIQPLEAVTLEDYLLLAQNNRGSLYENAVTIAAAFANSRKYQILKLRDCFNKVGLVSQIVNDINGSFGDNTEKSTKNDITSGKHSILSIIAYQNADPEQKKTLKQIIGKINATNEEVEKVREIYVSTGSVDFAKMYAANTANVAETGLRDIYPGLRRDAYEFFIAFIDHIANINI